MFRTNSFDFLVPEAAEKWPVDLTVTAHLLRESVAATGGEGVLVLGQAQVPIEAKNKGPSLELKDHNIPVTLAHEGVPVGRLTVHFSLETTKIKQKIALGVDDLGGTQMAWDDGSASRCRVDFRVLVSDSTGEVSPSVRVTAQKVSGAERHPVTWEADLSSPTLNPQALICFPELSWKEWALCFEVTEGENQVLKKLSLGILRPFVPCHLLIRLGESLTLTCSVTLECRDRPLVGLKVTGLSCFAPNQPSHYCLALFPQPTKNLALTFCEAGTSSADELLPLPTDSAQPWQLSPLVASNDLEKAEGSFVIPKDWLREGLVVGLVSFRIDNSPGSFVLEDSARPLLVSELVFTAKIARKILQFVAKKAEGEVEVTDLDSPELPTQKRSSALEIPSIQSNDSEPPTTEAGLLRAALLEEVRQKTIHFAQLIKEHEAGMRLFRKSREALEHQQQVLATLQKQNEMLQRRAAAEDVLDKELRLETEITRLSPVELKMKAMHVAQVLVEEKRRNESLRRRIQAAEKSAGEFQALERERERLAEVLRKKNEELREVQLENSRKEQLTATLARQTRLIAELESQLEKAVARKGRRTAFEDSTNHSINCTQDIPRHRDLATKKDALVSKVLLKRPEMFAGPADLERRAGLEVALAKAKQRARELEDRFLKGTG